MLLRIGEDDDDDGDDGDAGEDEDAGCYRGLVWVSSQLC